MWKNLSNYRDAALLFFRVTFGLEYIYVHGWPKLAGGISRWKEVGHAMKFVHIHFGFAFWGFMAAFSETICMGLLLIGLAFRPSCVLLVITMTVAAISDYHTKGGLGAASHALELCLLFIALIFIGPGKYSVDQG
ncbi:DoxX family protein [Chthoniobacter flavus Ellin428]|uniref:DoxX family protein n=1 Tax=Chthoniobacter flavus Ellin428 TaxID=497964 RepID=B4CYC1_9BACT|nr:DoxX family protein [Chthoniobacter flavus]EDY20462.1 DoxX family protein [Chthoniobacter flavus Ellin428]TCO85594.1 putative oxidoreductase [Chthoniobacter flavus]